MNTFPHDTTLIFKNIPKQIDDVSNFLKTLKIPAKEIKPFGRKRVLINYELKNEAEHALAVIVDLEFAGKPVNISWFRRDKPKESKEMNKKILTKKSNKSVQTVEEAKAKTNSSTGEQISKYVKKLYATEAGFGFNQPPPPYLKYNYPPINKDIMDNISISLLSSRRFYIQVLHLMNRMNLEPPFTKREYKFTPPGLPKETGTQTMQVTVIEASELAESNKVGSEDSESEMETSGEDEKNNSRCKQQLKRKLPTQPEQYKKKAKQILQTTQKFNKEHMKKTSTAHLSLKEIFETPAPNPAVTPKIEMHLKRSAKPEQLSIPEDLKAAKLSASELEGLAIYKNYQKGQPSNKLYIKNLHKDITDNDLRLIYERFIEDCCGIDLDIKVMQHGRMKGQAFVTFKGDHSENVQMKVAQALEETNGFVLRDKPMVVCYGKQS